MSTYQLSFKEDKKDLNPVLEVYVDSSGNIISADVYVPILRECVDCTELLEKSEYWKERILEELAERTVEKLFKWEPEDLPDQEGA